MYSLIPNRLIATFVLLVAVATPAFASLTLLSTSDNRGQLNACEDCPLALGGLAKRAALVNQQREKGPTLLVDGGNLFYGAQTIEEADELTASLYKTIGYDAINLSYRDFRHGLDRTRSIVEETDLPVISANLVDAKSGDLLFRPYLIRDVDGNRVAFLGLTSTPRSLDRLPHLKDQLKGIDVRSAEETLAKYIPELVEKADALVVAYYGNPLMAIREVRPYGDSIDALILESSPHQLSLPDTAVLTGKDRGKSLSRVRFDSSLAIVEEPDLVLVRSETAPDPQIASAINTHVQEVETARREREKAIAPTALAESPETGSTYRIHATDSHQGLGLTVYSFETRESLGDIPIQDNHQFLRLEVGIDNRISPRLVQGLGYAETVQVAALANKIYLVLNDRVVIRHDSDLLDQPGHLPDQFRLAAPGSIADGQVIFRIPSEGIEKLDLYLLHDEFPALKAELIDTGESPPLPEPVATGENEVASLSIANLQWSDSIRGQAPPEGMLWLTVDLIGESKLSRKADSAALDRSVSVDDNQKVEHRIPTDYGYFQDLVFLGTDENRLIPFDRELSEFPATPAFLPNIPAGGRLVFAAPEELKDHPLSIRAWFPTMSIAGGGGSGSVLPEPITLPIQTGAPLPVPDPIASIDDTPLHLDILAIGYAKEFYGKSAGPGNQIIGALIRMENRGEEPGLLPIGGRFALIENNNRIVFDPELTRLSPYHPTDNLYLSPGEGRVFELAFTVPDGIAEAQFDYRGASTNQRIGLTFDSIPEGSDSPTAGSTVTAEATPSEAVPEPAQLQSLETPDRDPSSPQDDGPPSAQPAETEEIQTAETAPEKTSETETETETGTDAEDNTTDESPVYRPHPDAVKADRGDDPIVWDARKPLEIEMPKGSNGDVFVEMKLPTEWVDQMWDLDIRMDVIDQEPPLRIYGEPGDRYALTSYNLRPAMTLTGFSVDGEIVPWSIGSGGRNAPAWRISLAITDVRPVPDDRITRPASDFDAPFDADGRLALRGELAEKESQYIRYRFDGEPELWRLTADSTNGALRDIEIMERSGRGIIAKNRTQADSHAIEISDFYVYPGEYVVRVRGNEQDYSLRWEREKDIVARTGMAVPEGEPEREPNVDRSLAHPLRWNEPWIGRLRTRDDTDLYRFFIPSRHPERVRLRVIPSGDAALDLRLPITGDRWNGEVGEPTRRSTGFYRATTTSRSSRIPKARGSTKSKSSACPSPSDPPPGNPKHRRGIECECSPALSRHRFRRPLALLPDHRGRVGNSFRSGRTRIRGPHPAQRTRRHGGPLDGAGRPRANRRNSPR